MAAPGAVIGHSKRKNTKYGSRLSFPQDIGSVPYHTYIRFVRYERPKSTSDATQQASGHVFLPMPAHIPEAYHMDYGGMSFNKFGADTEDWKAAKRLADKGYNASGQALAEFAASVAGQAGGMLYKDNDGNWQSDFTGSMGATLDAQFKNPSSEMYSALAGMLPRNMIDNPAGRTLLSDRIGKIANPHLTTVFNGVNLRAVTYEWNLYPRSEQDSIALRELVTFIKARMHPSYDQHVRKFALNYPDECFISFIGADSYLEQTNRCVLRDIALENAPNGPSFFREGAPVQVNLSMTFQEVEIRTREDWEGSVGSEGLSPSGTSSANEPEQTATGITSNLVEGTPYNPNTGRVGPR